MKKLLSLLLAICLCAVCFVGCNSNDDDNKGGNGGTKNVLKVSDVKNDPIGAVQNSVNGVMDWCTDDTGISSIAAEALKNGSVKLNVESETLFEMIGAEGLEKITSTVYTNAEEGRSVLEILIGGMDGTNIENYLYVGKTGIALDSEMLLGVAGTYMINFGTLVDGESLMSSPLPMLLGITEDMLAEFLAALNGNEDSDDEDLEDFMEAFANFETAITAISASLMENTTVKAGTFKDADGKSISCAVVSIAMDKETIVTFVESLYDAMPDEIISMIISSVGGDEEMTAEEVKAMMKQAVESVFDGADATCAVNFYLSLKTGKLVGVEVPVSIKIDAGDSVEETNFVLTTFLQDNGIVFEGTVSMGDYDTGARLSLLKTTRNNVVNYAATVDMIMGPISENLASLNYSYDKNTGAVKLVLDIPDTFGFEINGSVTKTATTAAIAIDSVKIKNVEVEDSITGDITLNLNLSLTFEKGTVTPAFPTEAIDVLKMDEDAAVALITAVQKEGLLGEIISAIIGGNESEEDVVGFPVKVPTQFPNDVDLYEVIEMVPDGINFNYFTLYDDGSVDSIYVSYYQCLNDSACANNYYELVSKGKSVQIDGANEAILYTDPYGKTLVWLDDEYTYILVAYETTISEANLLSIAGSVDYAE